MNIMLENIIGSMLNATYHISIIKKFTEETKRQNLLKNILSFLILIVLILINYFKISKYLGIPVIITILTGISYYIYKNKFIESLCIAITSQALIMGVELIISILYMIVITSDITFITNEAIGTLVMNTVICVSAYVVGKTRLPNKIYEFLEKKTKDLNNKIILIIFIIILFSINFWFASSYYSTTNFKLMIIINTILSSIYLIIVFRVFSVENKYIKMTDKYNTTLSSLKEYEEILDKYKIMNHENKNELLMIRNMIIKSDKDVDKYIDKIIDMKIKDDEKLMYESSIIPSGGLRAVIYSKILLMKEKKIKSPLLVDKKVRGINLSELGDEYVLDLCKIVNIYLDNAIEATEGAKKREILIELYVDSKEQFNIAITNTYKGEIETEKINEKGYTTKGEGHGYGLALAEKILNKHKSMNNVRKVSKNTFKQIITINQKSL